MNNYLPVMNCFTHQGSKYNECYKNIQIKISISNVFIITHD